MAAYKIISYNVAGRADLAGVRDLIVMHHPTIVMLQEVRMDTDQLLASLPRGYTGICNVDGEDSRKPGTAVVWVDGEEVQVTNILTCRLQVVRWGEERYINIYGHSGTYGQRPRRVLYGQTLLQEVVGMDIKPMLVGDWNCVTRRVDVEEDENQPLARRRTQFSRKSSPELIQLVSTCSYVDAFVEIHPGQVDFTWIRMGRRKSRLDRLYVPRERAGIIRRLEHVMHLGDHKALLATLVKRGGKGNRAKGGGDSETQWKLNSQVLQDRNFHHNWVGKLEELDDKRADREDLVEWWEEDFKPGVQGFLKGFSRQRQKSRRETKELLSACLQMAVKEEDWGRVAYCQARFGKMGKEDAMGLVIRSRHQELAEGEKASLYHLNREVKRGAKGALRQLAVEIEEPEGEEPVETPEPSGQGDQGPDQTAEPQAEAPGPGTQGGLRQQGDGDEEQESGEHKADQLADEPEGIPDAGQGQPEHGSQVPGPSGRGGQGPGESRRRIGIPGTGRERQEALIRTEAVSQGRKTKKKRRRIVEERGEREDLVKDFFTKLFQGFHGRNGEVGSKPFEPDFSELDFLLEGLGQLTPEQAEEMIREVNLEDVEAAVKKACNNKAPGLDGITYEFYKANLETMGPILTEVFNEQLARLKMPESNKLGATRLTSKLAGGQVPLVSELRPITLLNSDYKLLTMILAGRMEKVLGSILTSQQSCSVGDIASSAFNLLSTGEAAARQGDPVAILSLDLFKAYDRVNLDFLEKVMERMGFDDVFISWVRLLHEGAKTILLLDDMRTGEIEVTFSVRQGDPIAMVLFLIYIEPLIIRIQEATSGLAFKAADRPGRVKLPMGLVEKIEAYVDDAEAIITSDADLVRVDRVVGVFEGASGAVLNRSKKTRIMGLGAWRGRKDWPLPWIETVSEMKIFGVIMCPDWTRLLEVNWSDQLRKFKDTLKAWSSRVLDTLAERVHVVMTFAYSKVWYRAQILPLPEVWAARFEEAAASFIWRGQLTVHLLAMETVCLARDKGGLGLPYLRAKCDALLLMQMVRMMKGGKKARDHIDFWIGGRLQTPGVGVGSWFYHEEHTRGPRDNTPPLMIKLQELYVEARDSGRLDIFELDSAAAKAIYGSYTDTMPPPSIEAKHPDRDWQRTWKRVASPALSPAGQSVAFLLVHEKVGTRLRGLRILPTRFDSDTCNRCWEAQENQLHRYVKCNWVREAWEYLRYLLERLELDLRGMRDYGLLHLDFGPVRNEVGVLWLLGTYLEFVEEQVVVHRRRVTGHGLKGHLLFRKMVGRHRATPDPGPLPGLDAP